MAQSIIHPFEAIDIQHHHRQQLIRRQRLTLQRFAQSGTGIDAGLKVKIGAQGQLLHKRVNRFDTGCDNHRANQHGGNSEAGGEQLPRLHSRIWRKVN